MLSCSLAQILLQIRKNTVQDYKNVHEEIRTHALFRSWLQVLFNRRLLLSDVFWKKHHENQYFLQWGMNYKRCSILHTQHGIQKNTLLPGRLLFNGRLIKNPITSPLEYPSLETRKKKSRLVIEKRDSAYIILQCPISFIITQKITFRIGRTCYFGIVVITSALI